MDRSKKFSKIFYLFLVLLVLLQEVKSRTYPLDLHQSVAKSRNTHSFERNKRDTSKCYDDGKSFSKDAEDTKELKLHGRSREKRAILTGLLTGSVLVAMAGTLAVDVIAYVTKCCAFDKRVCDADTKIDEGKTRMRLLSANLNILWAQVENQYQYTETLNFKMEELWIHVQRIDETVTQMIELIDTSVIANLNETQKGLAERIAANNLEYENFESLKAEYESTFQNVWKTIYKYYGWITTPIYYFAYRWVANKIAAAGPGSLNRFRWYNPKKYILKSANWASAKWTALSTRFPKATKTFVTASSIISSGVYVAFEGWKIYNTVDKCRKFGDDVVEKLGYMVEVETNTTNLYNDVDEQFTDIKNNFTALKSQLLTSDLTTYLGNVKELVQNSATEFPQMEAALPNIDAFLNLTATASIAVTDTLVSNLNTALQSVTATMNCYREKLATVMYIVEECKKGSRLTLNALYQQKITSNTCATAGYITERNSVGMANSTLVSTDRVYWECIYNDADLVKSVCTLHRYGLSVIDIASSNSITEEQTNNFISYKCLSKDAIFPRKSTREVEDILKANLMKGVVFE